MRLTTFSDYSFRVLIYLGHAPEGLATIERIASAYRISPNHLMKVVHFLAGEGYIETVRGKGGGMRLAKPPREIRVGQVLRATEEGMDLVECMEPGRADCRIAPACVLRGALGEARDAFVASLDRYTLADLVAPAQPLAKLLTFTPKPRTAMPSNAASDGTRARRAGRR